MSAAVSFATAPTEPAPVSVCGCCARAYDMATFRALKPAAGHREFDADGQPVPVDGLIIKLCAGCTSSVAIEVWCQEWPSERTWDDVAGVPDAERDDGDPSDERDLIKAHRANIRMIERAP